MVGDLSLSCVARTAQRAIPTRSLMNRLCLTVFALMLSLAASAFAESAQDAEFDKVADEYIKGWLAAHPINATQLGIHDFDGRISDFTRLALDAELPV